MRCAHVHPHIRNPSGHTGQALRDWRERRQVESSVLSAVTVRKGRPSHCPSVSVKAFGMFTQWVNSKAARIPGKPQGARTCQAQDRSRVSVP